MLATQKKLMSFVVKAFDSNDSNSPSSGQVEENRSAPLSISSSTSFLPSPKMDLLFVYLSNTFILSSFHASFLPSFYPSLLNSFNYSQPHSFTQPFFHSIYPSVLASFHASFLPSLNPSLRNSVNPSPTSPFTQPLPSSVHLEFAIPSSDVILWNLFVLWIFVEV